MQSMLPNYSESFCSCVTYGADAVQFFYSHRWIVDDCAYTEVFVFDFVLYILCAAKKPNGGTVRKHISRKPITTNSKNVGNTASQPLQSKAMTETIPADLSDSTIQAFQDAMHFRPPINAPSHTAQITIREQTPTNGNDGSSSDASVERLPSSTSTENDYNGNVAGGRGAMLNGISLKDFEKHQKVLKEANLEKRRLLSQAIEQK